MVVHADFCNSAHSAVPQISSFLPGCRNSMKAIKTPTLCSRVLLEKLRVGELLTKVLLPYSQEPATDFYHTNIFSI
jgi:hypothetical protein